MKFKVKAEELRKVMEVYYLGSKAKLPLLKEIELEGELVEENLKCEQVHPECDVYHPEGHKPSHTIEELDFTNVARMTGNRQELITDKLNEVIKHINKCDKDSNQK